MNNSQLKFGLQRSRIFFNRQQIEEFQDPFIHLTSSGYQNSNQPLELPEDKEDFQTQQSTISLSVYENTDIDFMIIEETYPIQKIVTLSNEELLNHIKSRTLIKDKQIFMNFQATIWSQKIPIKILKSLWLNLIDIQNLQQQNKTFKFEQNTQICVNQEAYKQILKDVNRTFVSSINQNKTASKWLMSLQQVLVAYSNFDQVVGYTQGMNFLVGTLMVLINPNYDDADDNKSDQCDLSQKELEEVFWVLVFMLNNKERNWREFYLMDTPGIFKIMPRLSQRLQHQSPKVLQYLIDLEVTHLEMIFSPFFHTLMLSSTQWEFSSIIITLFLIDGRVFFLQLISSMCQQQQIDILKIDELGNLANYFRKDFIENFQTYIRHSEEKGSLIKDLIKIGLLSSNHYCLTDNLQQSNEIKKQFSSVSLQNISSKTKKIASWIYNKFSMTKQIK